MTDALQTGLAAAGSVAPRDSHEDAIAAIWCAVLDRHEVGVLDDFFDLEGSSLQAVEVVRRVRQQWGVNIGARDFFAAPTVAALAATVAARAPTDHALVHPRPAGAAPVLSFDQRRLWLEDQLLPGAAYNVHERRLIVGTLDVSVVVRTLDVIRERHESLRTRFPVVDGEPVPVVDPPASGAVEVVDVRGFAGERRAAALRLADDQATATFDLATGPLVRFLIVVLEDDEHVLAVTAHHIVCDNWSIMVFMREFVALYRAGGDAAASDLPELPVQYLDYAAWQARWLAGEHHDGQLEHWRRHLTGAPAALALPTTGHVSPYAGGPAARRSATLSPAETQALGELCAEHGATRFMVVLAAVAAVLGRWSGQSDVVVGVPVTGRNDPGLVGLIGLFVGTLPLRVDVTPTVTFDRLVDQVNRTCRDGYANSDVPLDVIVREVRAAEPARGSAPLFQVLLSAIDTDDVGTSDGLRFESLEPPPTLSKVELAFTIRVSDGGLRLEMEFDAVKHPSSMMELLVSHVAALLRLTCREPGRILADYTL